MPRKSIPWTELPHQLGATGFTRSIRCRIKHTMETRSPWKPSVSLLVILLVLALAPAHAARAATDSPFADKAEELGVPGGAVAYIDDGNVTRTEVFGHDGDGNPIDADTSFLWGSVSKPVASAVVKHLAEEGTLDLDAPAGRYVEGAPDAPVRSLLDHTAGLDFGAELLDVDRPDASAAEVIADAGIGPGARSGGGAAGDHRYSSLGYMVLQAIIESATGGTYQEAVQATPGADNVGASADACADVARGHRFAGPFTWPMDTGYDGAGAAYGYACGSIGDLAGFAASQLGSAEGIVGKLPDAQPTSTPGQLHGPGWRISMEPHRPTTVWHTGTVPGYFSAIYLDPESGDGAAVLLNASGYLREEALADLTAFAYDEATGPAAEKSFTDAPADAGGMANIVPAALLGMALLVVAAGWFGRRSIRAVAWAIGAVVVAAAAVVATPMLMGVPLRYFWLWEPGIVAAAAAVPVAMLAAAAMSAMADRQTQRPSAAPRPQMG